ncbi:hypothetical protein SAMN02910384_01731 [Pseudobutyrivibrio sp. ACV-2]|uniref:hypothetical protein n=1 Tax=Pseudobutyrivibrio sp. ACV-2 TaxID=1520801 RepID=UPI0008967522|nr:hypothetical protein [Pseudobutyrivibrio sp. ACV-2]SEA52667.1 hypothetical protein SAMN02910384_01731 [Pseudobutyrivibrio sp. ACV-2]
MGKDRNIMKRYFMLVLGVIIPIMTTFIYYFLNLRFGDSVFDLPISSWGDGILYYKQIESLVNGGNLQGYYGFNESHAEIGKMAAWSPIIYVPFTLLGMIAGWNYSSPIIYNVIYWIIAFELFVILLKPRLVQFTSFSIMWISFGILHYYSLQCMAESFIASLTVIYVIIAFKYSYDSRQFNIWLVIALVLLVLLTLMRGYCAVFGLPLFYFALKKVGKLVSAIIGIVMILSTATYIVIIKKYTSLYFWPLIDASWVRAFRYGIRPGIESTLERFLLAYSECKELILGTLARNYMWYASYVLLIIAMLWLLYKTFRDRKLSYVSVLIIPLAFIAAFWMLYDVGNGGRQFICLVCGFFLILAMDQKASPLIGVVLLLSFYMTWFTKGDVKFLNTSSNASFETEVSRLTDYLNAEQGISEWDNTIVWAYGTQTLYGVPSKFGLNCCRDEYLEENGGSLKAKYVMIGKGSPAEKYVQPSGWKYLDTFLDMDLYSTR